MTYWLLSIAAYLGIPGYAAYEAHHHEKRSLSLLAALPVLILLMAIASTLFAAGIRGGLPLPARIASGGFLLVLTIFCLGLAFLIWQGQVIALAFLGIVSLVDALWAARILLTRLDPDGLTLLQFAGFSLTTYACGKLILEKFKRSGSEQSDHVSDVR